MKTKHTSAFKIVLAALIGTTLATTSLRAQTTPETGNRTTTPPALRAAIWPVPSTVSVRINFEKRGRGFVQIRIYDSRGKLLYEQNEYTPIFAGKYDLSELTTGVYTIDLQSGNTHISQLVAINTFQPEIKRITLVDAPTADDRLATNK